MQKIPLTQGKVALVDDLDYVFLVSQGPWFAHYANGTWYAETRDDWRHVKMHRLLIPNSKMVDHKDGNGLNNQRNNLRACTKSQNAINRDAQQNGSSGYKGVSWHCRVRKWNAKIQFQGVTSSLGYFDSPEEAALAYDRAAVRLFGEFARLNFQEKQNA